jgi:colanic acid/amylovoran biosynthesis glycosyltransferase
MIVGYILNVYPRPNHSFIRRELAALEAQGVTAHRYALRSCPEAVDPADLEESRRTRFILERGYLTLLLHSLSALLFIPRAAIAGLRLAVRVGWRSDRGVWRHIGYWAEACVLKQWLAEDDVQHLHAHFGTNTAAIAMLTRVMGGPTYSFTVHGPEEFDRPQELSLREKMNYASFVVAISEFGRSQLFRWCPHDQWDKVKIVRCGVDATFLDAASSPVPSAPRFVSVGRLSPEKGQLLLMEAAAVLARRGIVFEIILVGGGAMSGEIERFVERHGLQQRVKMVGWKSNQKIRDLMLASRALVMPSFAEGLPVVIMESLALERPVLSTYLAGIPELVENGVSGFLVPAGSIDSLVAGMTAILQADPAALWRLGSAGAARVRKQHDAAVEAARLADLMAQTIARESTHATRIDTTGAPETSLATEIQSVKA